MIGDEIADPLLEKHAASQGVLDRFEQSLSDAGRRFGDALRGKQPLTPEAFHVVSTGRGSLGRARWWRLETVDYSLVGVWSGIGATLCLVLGVLLAHIDLNIKLFGLAGVFVVVAALLLVTSWRYGA